jgi:hypothetical protein
MTNEFANPTEPVCVVELQMLYDDELNLWQIIPIRDSGINVDGKWVIREYFVIREELVPLAHKTPPPVATCQERHIMDKDAASRFVKLRAMSAVLDRLGITYS